MAEAGIDLSSHTPKSVSMYLNEAFDYVITVCIRAKKSCPVFAGKAVHRLHMGFDDPSEASGSPDFIYGEFLRVRDEIKERFYRFDLDGLQPKLKYAQTDNFLRK